MRWSELCRATVPDMADRNMERGRMECHHPEREDGMSPPEGEWNVTTSTVT